jgi:hypothetical protein
MASTSRTKTRKPGTHSSAQSSATLSTTALLDIDESQSKYVCQELLPLAGTVPIPRVKTDHLLQLNRDNKHVAAVLNPLFVREPNLSLSAFDDPVSAKTFTAALVEVAAPSGDFEEGVYRFTVASAAILARLRLLMQQTGRTTANDPASAMPVLGWVVHGHFWYLHLSYQQLDGSIVSAWILLHLIMKKTLMFLLLARPWPAPIRQHSDIPRYLSSFADYPRGQDVDCFNVLSVSAGAS